MRFKVYARVSLVLVGLMALSLLYSCATEETLGPTPGPPARIMMMDGRPNFHAGLPASYFIWQERGRWHLRVTTAGARHQFMGAIEARGGFIQGFVPFSLETRDRVRVERNTLIRFDFWTRGDIDGFDWQSTSGCSFFINLLIDGRPYPERIFIGAFSDSPGSITFEACR